jgi:hypothetical protein
MPRLDVIKLGNLDFAEEGVSDVANGYAFG